MRTTSSSASKMWNEKRFKKSGTARFQHVKPTVARAKPMTAEVGIMTAANSTSMAPALPDARPRAAARSFRAAGPRRVTRQTG